MTYVGTYGFEYIVILRNTICRYLYYNVQNHKKPNDC